MTANARALRHFIEMRADPAADAEIRKVAVAVLKLLQAESPNLFGDYSIATCPGRPAATTTAPQGLRTTQSAIARHSPRRGKRTATHRSRVLVGVAVLTHPTNAG